MLTRARFAATKHSALDLSNALERLGAPSRKARADVNHVFGPIGKMLNRRWRLSAYRQSRT